MEITIEEFKSWLNHQKEGAFEKFLINFNNSPFKMPLEDYLLAETCPSIDNKIMNAFTWLFTPQEGIYWSDIDTQWRDYIERNNITKIVKMETKSVKIDIPEGYEIDKEKSTFENIVFKKIGQKFSKSWEEFCKNNRIDGKESYISDGSIITKADIDFRDIKIDGNLVPSKFAEPMLALMQLLTIREKEYTKGWEPTYDGYHDISVIWNYNGTITTGCTVNSNRILTFPNGTLRDEFLKNWKYLIELAKPLL